MKNIFGKNRYEKRRSGFRICAVLMFALVAVVTLGLPLLALAAPKAVALVGTGLAKAFLGGKSVMAAAIAPFKFVEPVTKINGVASGQVATVEFPPLKRANSLKFTMTATKAAGGAGVYSVPKVSDAGDLYQFKVGGKPQRTRKLAEMFGARLTNKDAADNGCYGLNTICDANLAGMVVYSQAGNANLSTIPVLIGSAADTTQQNLLVANTATTATFYFAIHFSETFRKEYDKTELLALATGYVDGSTIGVCTLEVLIPTVAGITGQSLNARLEYDDLLMNKGTQPQMLKEYRQVVQYAAAGEIEVAQQLYLRDGLNRVSLLTTADKISKVVVKQGSRILRQLSWEEMVQVLVERDYNLGAVQLNRFDIEFDLNDDPASAPQMSPNLPLSIVATMATAADATKNIVVCSSYFGPLD